MEEYKMLLNICIGSVTGMFICNCIIALITLVDKIHEMVEKHKAKKRYEERKKANEDPLNFDIF